MSGAYSTHGRDLKCVRDIFILLLSLSGTVVATAKSLSISFHWSLSDASVVRAVHDFTDAFGYLVDPAHLRKATGLVPSTFPCIVHLSMLSDSLLIMCPKYLIILSCISSDKRRLIFSSIKIDSFVRYAIHGMLSNCYIR
jgi:bifunctional pyridoxal-dependent enzyme with beta-cystathionase and maltose regulon repressor activities